jgi:hypothetical protein
MVAAKFLMRCGGADDVVSRCLNYRPGPYTSAAQPADALISPGFVAGANFLGSGRRVWAGEVITE